MADKVWIPIDVYFMSRGFPLTHERAEKVRQRLESMGYSLDDLDSFKEIHEKLMDEFYRYKDMVHIKKERTKKKKRGKRWKR